ncbi:GlsB/YeaQ/YmgE family stress response membrane protein [Candidatus Saccharibacteria bacterium]|nr:MAG: GlsB/YeaQ/YmgE family stress response membrane protein [Candidatus Saccharibacteria bacterium]
MIWTIITWIVLGALAGWIASMIVGTNREQGGLMNIVVGIVGAVIGGWIMAAFGSSGVTGFNIQSVLVAVLGSVVLLLQGRLFTGRHTHHTA